MANIGAEIININTDGVAYIYNGTEDELIKSEWEKEFNLKLETDHFKKMIQADVNNYIAITEDDYILTKGGYVNKYHSNRYFANNDIRITQIALVDYLVKGIPVQETLLKNLDNPLLYQYILKAGGTYKGVVLADNPEQLLSTTTNRVFASKEKGVEILKKRQDGGVVKFADAPENMMIWNEDVKDLQDFEKKIDLQWYYDLTMKNLQNWK